MMKKIETEFPAASEVPADGGPPAKRHKGESVPTIEEIPTIPASSITGTQLASVKCISFKATSGAATPQLIFNLGGEK